MNSIMIVNFIMVANSVQTATPVNPHGGFQLTFFPTFITITIILAVAEFFLAKNKKSWPGMIIPILLLAAFLGFIIYLISSVMNGNKDKSLDVMLIFAFLIIPTLITSFIYFFCRLKFYKSRFLKFPVKDKDKDEINKMNIQDLH